MKSSTAQGLGVVASRWLGGGKAKSQGRRMGWGAIAFHHRHVLFGICSCISVSTRKVAGEHAFCVLIYANSHIFHIYFILFHFVYSLVKHISITLSLYAWRCHWPTHMELPVGGYPKDVAFFEEKQHLLVKKQKWQPRSSLRGACTKEVESKTHVVRSKPLMTPHHSWTTFFPKFPFHHSYLCLSVFVC